MSEWYDDMVADYYDDDYDDDDYDDRDPEPDEEAIAHYEYERHMRSLSPAGRVAYRVRALIWRHTWRWRIRANGGEAPF